MGSRRRRGSQPSYWRGATTRRVGSTSRSSPARSSSTGGRATTPSIPTRSSAGARCARGERGGERPRFPPRGGPGLAVFTVVNAIGAIVDREGNVVRGHYDRKTGLRRKLVPGVEERLASGAPVRPPPGNTTLTVVATNLR